jgi:hypothetical protein
MMLAMSAPPARAGCSSVLGDDPACGGSKAGVAAQRIFGLEIEVAFDREFQRAAQRFDLLKADGAQLRLAETGITETVQDVGFLGIALADEPGRAGVWCEELDDGLGSKPGSSMLARPLARSCSRMVSVMSCMTASIWAALRSRAWRRRAGEASVGVRPYSVWCGPGLTPTRRRSGVRNRLIGAPKGGARSAAFAPDSCSLPLVSFARNIFG